MTTFLGLSELRLVPIGPASDEATLVGGLLAEAIKDQLVVDSIIVTGDPTICNCRAHGAVEAGVPDGVGCAGLELGTDRWVSSASRGEGHDHVCLADAGTRFNDKKMALLVLGAFRGGTLLSPLKKATFSSLATTKDGKIERYGAGYCYLEPVRSKMRSRAARILGPLPYLVAVAALVSRAGQGPGRRVELIKVAEGVYHAERTNEGCENVAVDFLIQCGRIVSMYGVHVKLGAAFHFSVPNFHGVLPSGVTDIGEWLVQRGAGLGSDASVDLFIATFPATVLEEYGEACKVRAKVLEAMGDGAIRMVLAQSVLSSGGTVADLADLHRTSGPALLPTMLRVDVPFTLVPRGSKSYGRHLRALVGVVAAYRGLEVVRVFLLSMGCRGVSDVIAGPVDVGLSVGDADDTELHMIE